MNISKRAIRASDDARGSGGVGGAARAPDPFYVERNLRAWASSRVISKGRDYYRQGRVSSLDSDEEGGIVAQVGGSTEQPYRVELRFARSGPPASRCSCPYNWEPLCKHAVAALIAWQQAETGSEPELGASSNVPAPDEAEGRKDTLRELAAIEREDRRRRLREPAARRPRSSPAAPASAPNNTGRRAPSSS
ncbi:MAG: hypothetical protein HY928_17685 [Elusimicrobia bacterium]|nr:hypothetical protein [Elusimicrobiota bacterium]